MIKRQKKTKKFELKLLCMNLKRNKINVKRQI